MIKKKLASRGGFTMTELLVTVAIISLLGVAVAVGISTAARAYTNITMSSEASVLSGTLAVELADELRFAENISGSGSAVTFTSRRFGANASVTSPDGRVMIGGSPILSSNAYTGLNAAATVSYDSGVFSVVIDITSATGKALGSTSFSVRPISG